MCMGYVGLQGRVHRPYSLEHGQRLGIVQEEAQASRPGGNWVTCSHYCMHELGIRLCCLCVTKSLKMILPRVCQDVDARSN